MHTVIQCAFEKLFHFIRQIESFFKIIFYETTLNTSYDPKNSSRNNILINYPKSTNKYINKRADRILTFR